MARTKTTKRKRSAWNKGRALGQRAPLSPREVSRIKRSLTKRGERGMRDLALFSTAIDSMLRAQDLVGLKVKDVRKRNRVMRDTLDLTTANGGQSVECVLSDKTKGALSEWIDESGKKPGDYLFTGRIRGSQAAMSTRQLSRLVKTWTSSVGLDETLYGTESLRRTRSIHILNRTGNMEAVRILLGLADIRATSRYLGGANPVDALTICRSHEM